MPPEMMQAVWYSENGEAAAVLQHGEAPMPRVGGGEVLVRLSASGVNPSDVKSRRGSRGMSFDKVIPHSDGAGIVKAVGSGVNPNMIGSRVYVRNGQWGRAFGTAASYIALPVGLVHPLPDSVSFEVGAALGIPALTAAYAVLKDGPVADRNVLIHGGGGTVANLAIQIAVDSGARVIASTGDMSKGEMITGAGAAAVFDYRDENMVARVIEAADGQPVSRIIDAECGQNLASSIDIISPKGFIVGYGSVLNPDPELPFMKMMFKNAALTSILVYLLEEDEAAAYAAIVNDMLEREALSVPIAEILPLSEAVRAHEMVEAGDKRGSVVLSIDA